MVSVCEEKLGKRKTGLVPATLHLKRLIPYPLGQNALLVSISTKGGYLLMYSYVTYRSLFALRIKSYHTCSVLEGICLCMCLYAYVSLNEFPFVLKLLWRCRNIYK